MTRTRTTRYDVAEHLRTPKEMAAYLEACLEEAGDDAAFIAKALGDVARAKGMAGVARWAGLSRESLYKALSGRRSPSFDTVLRVMAALQLRLRVQSDARSSGRSGRGDACSPRNSRSRKSRVSGRGGSRQLDGRSDAVP